MAELGDQLVAAVVPASVDDGVAHALIFPLPAMGHIMPLFQLAQALASTGFRSTFLTPARYHPRLEQILASSSSPHAAVANVRLLAARDGLPTDPSFDPPFIPDVSTSIELLEAHVDELLQQHPYTCFISDNVIPWVQAVAQRNGIPRVDFWPLSATAVSMIYQMPLLESQGFIPYEKDGSLEDDDTMISCIPGLPSNMRASEFVEGILVKDPSSHLPHQHYQKAHEKVNKAERVLIHTAFDLEPEAVNALRSYKLPVYTVGPLLSYYNHSTARDQPRTDPCLEWLDNQASSSVLYIAFGSTGSWTPLEIEELAKGLEASQQPFLWVVRPSLYTDHSETVHALFSREALEQGLIVPWAPQTAVLQHPSVGGFLTHCGWNSVMESLYMGVPLIGWPKISDQTTNMRLVSEEWKVGIALGRSRFSSVDRFAIEKAVKALMHGDEGKRARLRAAEIKETLKTTAAMTVRDNLQKFGMDMTARATGRSNRDYNARGSFCKGDIHSF